MKAGIKAPLTQPAINKRSLILSASPRIGVFLTYKNKDTAPKEMIDKISQFVKPTRTSLKTILAIFLRDKSSSINPLIVTARD